MGCVIGIDLGTTNFKFAVVDPGGEVRGLARERVAYSSQKTDNGLLSCELGPDRFARIVRAGIGAACDTAGVTASDIEAVSYASQANSFLLIDGDSQPLTPIVSWQDTARRPGTKAIRELISDSEFERTGLGRCSDGILAARAIWYQREQPELWHRVRRILTISDYLCTIFTGEYVGDSGTAARLGLWDVVDETWWEGGLKFAGIDRQMLPRLVRPGTPIGGISREGERAIGLREGTPLVAGNLDHHVAALGAGVGTQTEACESTGTVLSCVCMTDSFRPASGISLGPGTSDGSYYALSFDNAGGSVLRDFRDRHSSGRSFVDIDRLAALTQPGSNGWYLKYASAPFDAADGLENPLSDETVGLHARAIMEAGAMRLRRLFTTLFPDGAPAKFSATGGGGKSEVWSRIKADIIGSTVVQLDVEEPGCLGAAGLAGIGAGWHDRDSPVPDWWVRVKRVVKPDQKNHLVYRRLLAAEPEISRE